jgi:anti-sigma-K factor RskA
MNYNRPELLDHLASEYVLGTLHGRARRRFEHVLRHLPAAQEAVRAWEARLAPLASVVPPVRPPARVWAAISSRTDGRRTVFRAGWWKPLLGFALGSLLTVGVVQLIPGSFVSLDRLAQKEQALPQSYVGLLVDKEGQPTLLISSTRHGTRVTVKSLRPVAVPPGKVLQVWALPRDGAPFPLGIATPTKPPASTHFEMSGTSEKLLANVPRLAVSMADGPAKPGATPGEFILTGHCVKLW